MRLDRVEEPILARSAARFDPFQTRRRKGQDRLPAVAWMRGTMEEAGRFDFAAVARTPGATGGHDFGVVQDQKLASSWPDLCLNWLHSFGLLKDRAK